MLYREIMAVCSQIHTKHINAPCVHKKLFLKLIVSVYILVREQPKLTFRKDRLRLTQLQISHHCQHNDPVLTPPLLYTADS